MTKFSVYSDCFEIRSGEEHGHISADEIISMYTADGSCAQTFIGQFDTFDEAQDNLCWYGTQRNPGNGCKSLIVVNIAYIAEEELDDDGEFIQEIDTRIFAEGCDW